MGWFSKDAQNSGANAPEEMTPLQAVTHLCACVQLSDGDADFEERKAWLNTIINLFPSFSEERADNFLSEAHLYINKCTGKELNIYTEKILHRVKEVLTKEQIKVLGARLKSLIEADGIVMNSEVEIASIIERNLSIKLNLDKEL